MTRKKITVKLVFGAVQALLALVAIVLALVLKFDLFNIQSSMSIPKNALNFYFVIFLFLGFVGVVSGLFQVYDWWES